MPRGPKPLNTKLKANEFYCVCCRKRRVGSDIELKIHKNKKRENGKVPMLKARCAHCDCNMNKIVKDKAVAGLRKKY
jgi:hypothetical protein